MSLLKPANEKIKLTCFNPNLLLILTNPSVHNNIKKKLTYAYSSFTKSRRTHIILHVSQHRDIEWHFHIIRVSNPRMTYKNFILISSSKLN
ncbi:hypothetical protein HanPI659440_Chr12g0474921 [Helianthus annuus]|nr:hypothetical protein HanPI659440_Chr12g0474921 [Helianthus annuus]